MSAASWLGWVCGRYVPPQRTAGHLESWQRATCPVLMVLVSRSMKGERSRPLHLWLALPQDLSLVSGDPTWLHTNARTYTHTVYLFFLSLSLSLSLIIVIIIIIIIIIISFCVGCLYYSIMMSMYMCVCVRLYQYPYLHPYPYPYPSVCVYHPNCPNAETELSCGSPSTLSV